MTEPPQSESRRVSAACLSCRHSKLKCSGTRPCDRCQKRSQECVYDDRENGDGQGSKRTPSTRKRPRISDGPSRRLSYDPIRPAHPEVPFSPTPNDQTRLPPVRLSRDNNSSPRFLRNRPDKRKRWLYLGASSTWSFNIRVASLLRAQLKDDHDDSTEEFTLDGDAYNITLKKINSDAQPDISRLPSLDYAIYLINTVKFHLGGILRLFDEEEFLHHLTEFYAEGPEKVGMHKLWYTQCLLLLALGKGFLNIRRSPDNTSSTEYFSRAMSILPDMSELHEEPVLATEVLATIALYLYCVDMKQSAYSYIGQALRLALVEGLHADLPVSQMGEKFSERLRNVWWTVYILDRTLSSAVGTPVSVQDDHISQPLGIPQQSSQRDATLIMHVKLCRVVSYILTELYTADGNLEHSYLTKTRSVLRRMAEIAKELEEIIDFKFKSSLETVSKGALYLRLLYNQCIILATRPLLLCLLQEVLRSMSTQTSNRIKIPNSIKDLLQACIDSATKTLKMLCALNDHNLLDTFLPFDLEFACSAASVLIMVDDVLRGVSISLSTKSLVDQVLDEITAGGNKAAPFRQKELHKLSQLAHRLWRELAITQHASHNRDQTPSQPAIASPSANQISALQSPVGRSDVEDFGTRADMPSSSQMNNNIYSSLISNNWTQMAPPSTTSSAEFAHTFDFSQEQMLILADQLDVDAVSTMLDFTNHGLNEWL